MKVQKEKYNRIWRISELFHNESKSRLLMSKEAPTKMSQETGLSTRLRGNIFKKYSFPHARLVSK